MAVSIFACPDCGSTLKTKQALAPGTKIKCPKCQTVFAIPEGNGAAEVDEEAPPTKRPVAAGKDAPRKAGAKPPPVPRKEEFAEYDDSDDDDEKEVRPKKKKKFKSKKKSPALNPALIGGIVGVVVLLVVGGVLGWVWPGFFIKLGNEPLAYVPPASTLVVSVDVETFVDRMGTGAQLDQFLGQIPAEPGEFSPADCKKETGLEFRELVSQVTVATLSPVADLQTSKVKWLFVAKSKVPFDRAKVAHFLEPKAQGERLKGRTIYRGKSKTGDPTVVYIPTDQLFVAATNLTDADLEPILASHGIKPLLSPETMAFVEPVRANQVWAVAPLDSSARQKIQQMIRSSPAGSAPDTPSLQAALPNAKAVGAWLSVENNQVKLTLGVMCADADTAKKVSGEAQHSFDKETKGAIGAGKVTLMLALIPEAFRPFVEEVLRSVQFTAQGETAMVSVQASVGSVKTVVQAGQGMFMGGAGGMPAGMNPNVPGGQPPAGPPRGGRGRGRPPR